MNKPRGGWKGDPKNQRKELPIMTPESAGAIKKDHPWHMSLDELIDYRETGSRPPKMILDSNIIYRLAKKGASINTIADLFEVSHQTIKNTAEYIDAHRRGLAELNVRNRFTIIAAAEEGNLQANIHLDKVMNKETQEVSMTVTTQGPDLSEYTNEDLIRQLKDEDN